MVEWIPYQQGIIMPVSLYGRAESAVVEVPGAVTRLLVSSGRVADPNNPGETTTRHRLQVRAAGNIIPTMRLLRNGARYSEYAPERFDFVDPVRALVQIHLGLPTGVYELQGSVYDDFRLYLRERFSIGVALPPPEPEAPPPADPTEPQTLILRVKSRTATSITLEWEVNRIDDNTEVALRWGRKDSTARTTEPPQPTTTRTGEFVLGGV